MNFYECRSGRPDDNKCSMHIYGASGFLKLEFPGLILIKCFFVIIIVLRTNHKLQLYADTFFDNINIANSLCQDLLVLSITSSIHQSFLLKEYKISSSNGRVSGVSENLGIILRK